MCSVWMGKVTAGLETAGQWRMIQSEEMWLQFPRQLGQKLLKGNDLMVLHYRFRVGCINSCLTMHCYNLKILNTFVIL